MIFDNNNIEMLLSESKAFSLEGFNIFAIGKDDLPHIVCTAPNKSIARALHGLLETAKKAHDLPGINGYVTGDAALVPQVLANWPGRFGGNDNHQRRYHTQGWSYCGVRWGIY